MTTKQRDGSLSKSARLVLLREWKAAGLLDGLSAAKIGGVFRPRVHRQTIWRDMKDLEKLERTIRKMKAQ